MSSPNKQAVNLFHKQFPTRAHRIVAVPFASGLVLLGGALLLGMELPKVLGALVFGALSLCLSLLDMRYMLGTGKGTGRLSGHINRANNPLSFVLHLLLHCIFVSLWGFLALAAMRRLVELAQ